MFKDSKECKLIVGLQMKSATKNIYLINVKLKLNSVF